MIPRFCRMLGNQFLWQCIVKISKFQRKSLLNPYYQYSFQFVCPCNNGLVFPIIPSFIGMATGHLIGAVLTHAEAVAPAISIDSKGHAGLELQCRIAFFPALSASGTGRFPCWKSKRVLFRPKIDWKALPVTLTDPFEPWTVIVRTRPDTPRSETDIGRFPNGVRLIE